MWAFIFSFCFILQTVWFFLPGPEADSTSSGQQPFKLFLTLGREMKVCSVTCARVSKAASDLCGEKCPETWAVTSNPGLGDLTTMQSLEVICHPGLAVANREERGSLGTNSTAFDCRDACGRWECCSTVSWTSVSIFQLKTCFIRDRTPRVTQPQVVPTGSTSRWYQTPKVKERPPVCPLSSTSSCP